MADYFILCGEIQSNNNPPIVASQWCMPNEIRFDICCLLNSKKAGAWPGLEVDAENQAENKIPA
jgi:hypothetical protein